ncbi:MAG: S-layer homology domain-containing protein [Clostridia bacterium]|nr:S-layer homology domain-containing protein [Clostridia bacterium]
MKRIAAILLSVLMMLASSPSAWAAEDGGLTVIDNNINTTCVTLELSSDASSIGKSAVLRVYAQDADETIANMLWADEGIIGADGKCIFTVDMSGYDTNKYVFVSTISGVNEAFRTDALQIYGAGEKADLLTKLTLAKANEDISELEWVVENRWEYLSLDKEGYDAIADTEDAKYHEIFCKNVLGTQFATLDEFADKFNKTVCIADLYITTDAQGDVKAIAEKFGLTQSTAYKDYTNEADTEIANLVSAQLAGQCTELTADNFEQSFNTAVIFKLLADNTDTWSGYEAVIGKYAAELGIEMSVYNSLSNQSAVINGMIANNGTYSSLEDVALDFAQLVDAQKSKESENSGSSGSSGGGSSGGGGSRSNQSGGFAGGSVTAPSAPTTDTDTEQSAVVQFTDMESSLWAVEAVSYLADKGIVSGRGDSKFDPEGNITRAEAVKLLVTAFDIPASGDKVNFADVKPEHWYYEYVCAAYSSGMVSGVSDNEFAPDANITRQDIAVLLDRVIKGEDAKSELAFSDKEQIADYARQAVANLVDMGVISGMGNGSFEPNGYTTRAQAAKMLYQIIGTEVQ